MTPPIEASSSNEGQVASEQAIVCGAPLPGRSPALWAGSVTQQHTKSNYQQTHPYICHEIQQPPSLRLNRSFVGNEWTGWPGNFDTGNLMQRFMVPENREHE